MTFGTFLDRYLLNFVSAPSNLAASTKAKYERHIRDESSIRRYFLTKAAKRLGIYWKGFGWHAFRREAITSMAAFADPIQAMRLAGHTRMEVTLLYGLNDLSRQSAAICRFQEQLGITPTLTR